MDLPLAIKIVELIVVLVVDIYLLTYLFRGAIYLPSHPKAIEQMVRALDVKAGEHAVDLGSGDGCILIALAKAGAIATGYEVSPPLVWWSRRRIRAAGVANHVTVVRKSFWRADFSSFQCVTLFGMTHIMRELEEKLLRELPPGARVTSNGFKFPNWKGEQVAPGVHLYKKEGR
jgi:hypothetical protein